MNEGDLVHALELITSPAGAPLVQSLDEGLRKSVEQSRSWTTGPNVVGTGVSWKITSGVVLQDQSLKLYVTKKLSLSALTASQRIPPTVALPGIGELTTDVEEIGVQRLESYSSKVRPLQPAYSIGQLSVATGTLGCLVAKTSDPLTPLLLSNSHVLAQYGLAPNGTEIVQPGSDDGGGDADVVGKLLESVIFDFDPGFNNICDAALATLNDQNNVTASIPFIGIPSIGAPALAPGQQVQKSGWTTGHTTGLIKDVHYRTYMSYPKPGGGWGTVGFRDQVLCEKYSSGGDSGALVCDMTGRAVGLHWCGSDSISVFSPITFVLDALGVQLWTPGV
jgi:hypothetical protein